MPKEPSPSARTTLYRVRGIDKLKDAIRPKYLKSGSFTAKETKVVKREALLIQGTMHRKKVLWADRLNKLSNVPVEIGSKTAAALLLIRAGPRHAWVLAYGMGFHLLEPKYVDARFGLRVAIRTATPNAIQSLTRSELDYRSRTDRSSIPAGEALRGFGIGGFGEVITRLSSSAVISKLAVDNTTVRIRAADALSVPLGKTPSALISDLDAIAATLKLSPQPELEVLEQFFRVKNPTRIKKLNKKLKIAIKKEFKKKSNKGLRQIALGWPHKRINDNGTPSSFKLIGTGERGVEVRDDLPTLKDLLKAIKKKTPDDPLSGASSIKVLLFRDSDGNEPMSTAIPAINWLFFEVQLDGIRYCLFDSRWYAMDTNYAEHLQVHVDEIFKRPPSINLPDWDVAIYSDENAYNSMAASKLSGVVLDRQLLRTKQHSRGFEACDILTPDGKLIHVKHAHNSSALSHLIAQVLVATDALRYDNEAREQLREQVKSAGGDDSWLPERLSSVTLGLARSKRVTGGDLFSFSQVTLTRLDLSLAGAGIKLTIAPIKRV